MELSLMINNLKNIDLKTTPLSDKDLSCSILKYLQNYGYVIVKNINVNMNEKEAHSDYFKKITALVGTHVQHDDNNKIVWDIKENKNSTSSVKTYSEHSDEALLHTDSQYRVYPEDYMALWMINPASCQGGTSLIMTLNDILTEIKLLPDAEKVLKALADVNFPFVVPSVFNQKSKNGVEYVFAPILKNNQIRFRVDTIEKALLVYESKLSVEAIDAFKILKSIVQNSKLIKRVHLEPLDMLLTNNKTTLHGRTAFTDDKRHLLRIRFNSKCD